MSAEASEPVARRAARYLIEGRVAILRLTGGHVQARVAGDHGVYLVERRPDGDAMCSCPVRVGVCAHEAAVRMVVPVWDPEPPARAGR